MIQCKKSDSHVDAHLAREIGEKADVFFKSVYSLQGVDAKELKNYEKTWRSRYAKLMAAHARAKLDVGGEKGGARRTREELT